MDWTKVTMTAEQVARGDHMKLQDDFGARFMALGAPKGVAMYSLRDGDDFCYYFSPQSSAISDPITAGMKTEKCDKPSKDGIAFLVGNESDREALLR